MLSYIKWLWGYSDINSDINGPSDTPFEEFESVRVGILKNQGCLNSLLQYLYQVPAIRRLVYEQQLGEQPADIPLILKDVFFRLEICERAISCQDLIRALQIDLTTTKAVDICQILLSPFSLLHTHFLAQGETPLYLYGIELPELKDSDHAIYDTLQTFVAEKKLSSLPSILPLYFDRCIKDDTSFNYSHKQFIQFPTHLDLTDFEWCKPESSNSNQQYRLFAVLVRSIEEQEERFYTFVRSDSKWLKLQDSEVTEVPEDDFIYKFYGGQFESRSAYMWIYIHVSHWEELFTVQPIDPNVRKELFERFSTSNNLLGNLDSSWMMVDLIGDETTTAKVSLQDFEESIAASNLSDHLESALTRNKPGGGYSWTGKFPNPPNSNLTVPPPPPRARRPRAPDPVKMVHVTIQTGGDEQPEAFTNIESIKKFENNPLLKKDFVDAFTIPKSMPRKIVPKDIGFTLSVITDSRARELAAFLMSWPKKRKINENSEIIVNALTTFHFVEPPDDFSILCGKFDLNTNSLYERDLKKAQERQRERDDFRNFKGKIDSLIPEELFLYRIYQLDNIPQRTEILQWKYELLTQIKQDWKKSREVIDKSVDILRSDEMKELFAGVCWVFSSVTSTQVSHFQLDSLPILATSSPKKKITLLYWLLATFQEQGDAHIFDFVRRAEHVINVMPKTLQLSLFLIPKLSIQIALFQQMKSIEPKDPLFDEELEFLINELEPIVDELQQYKVLLCEFLESSFGTFKMPEKTDNVSGTSAKWDDMQVMMREAKVDLLPQATIEEHKNNDEFIFQSFVHFQNFWIQLKTQLANLSCELSKQKRLERTQLQLQRA